MSIKVCYSTVHTICKNFIFYIPNVAVHCFVFGSFRVHTLARRLASLCVCVCVFFLGQFLYEDTRLMPQTTLDRSFRTVSIRDSPFTFKFYAVWVNRQRRKIRVNNHYLYNLRTINSQVFFTKYNTSHYVEAMSVRLSVVTPMSQIQHSGGRASFVHITACLTKLPMFQAIWRKKIRYWIVNGKGCWRKRSCYSLCYYCNIFVQELRKPRKTEVTIVGVPAECLNRQPPNTRQGAAAWDNLPPHSCIRN